MRGAFLVQRARRLEALLAAINATTPGGPGTLARQVSRVAWCGVVPTAILLIGSATNWISWWTLWPAIVGILTPLGAAAAFGSGRAAIVARRKSLQESSTSLLPAGTPLAGGAEPLLGRGPGTRIRSLDPFPEERFDLTALSPLGQQETQSTRVRVGLLVGGAAAFLAILIYLAGVPTGSSVGPALTVIVPIVVLVAVAAFLGSRRSRGVSVVQIRSSGVRFTLDNGRILELRRDDPDFLCFLRDYAPTASHPAGVPGPRYWIQGYQPEPFFGPIDELAARRFLDRAMAAGLAVSQSAGFTSERGGTISLNVRITAPSPRNPR